MQVHERLREWRVGKGYSQGFAGELVGVRQATWSEWESGKSRPQIDQILAIQHATRGRIRAEMWSTLQKKDHQEREQRVLAASTTAKTGTEG